MHLEHAILGFLNYGPWTGYELKRVFDQSIRHFWPADQSQIYKTLLKLSRKGLASVKVVHEDDRPSRKIYSITDAGRDELMGWVGRPPEPEVFREPFLIQVFFAGLLSDEDAISVLEAKHEELAAIRDQLMVPRDHKPDGDAEAVSQREQFYRLLTLEQGLWSVQTALDWIDNTIDRIRRGESAHGPAVLPPPVR
jgi:PadR family transcriptional regulator, regulatory protein AphA